MTVAAAAVEKEGHATNVLCFGAPAILPRSFLEDDSYCDQICTKEVTYYSKEYQPKYSTVPNIRCTHIKRPRGKNV